MKAMVIAGGVPQMELLRQLKERKIETVLLDGNENCLARAIPDKFYKVNIFNIEDVKKIAVDEKVDFIITVCADQVLLLQKFLRCSVCLAILDINRHKMYLIKSE